jgi:hypothetical protein
VAGSLLNCAQTSVTSGGGNVALGFASAPAQVAVNSGGGDIEVAVPPAGSDAAGYRIQAAASGGATSIGVIQDPNGRHVITLSADGGVIQIRYGDASADRPGGLASG